MRLARTRACRAAGWCSVVLLTGCGRYAEFTLPKLAGGGVPPYFRFEAEAAPVMTRGEAWDKVDVLNPSVIRDGSGSLVNLYSGFDGGKWRTGITYSSDGLHWTSGRLVVEPEEKSWEGSYIAANGSAVWQDGEMWYWYVAGPMDRPSIGLARLRPGQDGPWRKEPRPVLLPGPYQSWDEYGVADPYVIRIEPYFYLYYLGQDRAHRQRLGVARSKDGIHFEKLRSNPILEIGADGLFDDDAMGEPAVWAADGYYWMLYTGRDRRHKRSLGMARSTDGVHFSKLQAEFSGHAAWDSEVICDPTVLVENGIVRVWFGGGNARQDAENLNGQIGYGVLRRVQ